MKPYDRAQCEAMLEAAKAAQIGAIIHCFGNSWRARAMLYEARRGNPELASLQIRFSPDDPDNDLWIFNDKAASDKASPKEIGI